MWWYLSLVEEAEGVLTKLAEHRFATERNAVKQFTEQAEQFGYTVHTPWDGSYAEASKIDGGVQVYLLLDRE
jgi:hypothetical protein